MAEQRNLEEIGLEAFAIGQVPETVSVTDTTTEILPEDPDRAYAEITLRTDSAGVAFMARGTPALDAKGTLIVENVPFKVFGPAALNGICGTPAATATIIFQQYLRGLPRQGVAV